MCWRVGRKGFVSAIDIPEIGPEKRCHCGFANEAGERIVGGQNASRNEFPWVVAIKDGNFTFCGGTLINDRYVLTASHCVVKYKSYPSQLTVVLGEHHLEEKSQNRTRIKASEIIMHPRYMDDLNMNDIALIKMNEPVTFDSWKSPICFPRPDIDYDSQHATVIGWGRLVEGGSTALILQKVQVPIVSLKQCRQAIGKNAILTSMICANWPKGRKDSCNGDSGGPLMIEVKARWQLLGIVSYGYGCAKPNHPGVYTRVDKFYKWIDQQTPGICLH